MSNDRKFGGLVGVLGVSMAVCCGLRSFSAPASPWALQGWRWEAASSWLLAPCSACGDGAATEAPGTTKFPTRGPTSDSQPA
ncbi:MAG TPA: hypothetical protein VMZ51_03510 [Acidimicrobiales bacterium]|nr:hypothetical protein [Acidimicrobiales bacterium]